MQFEHKGIYSVLLNLDFGAKLPVSIIHVSLRLYSHLLVNNREWFVSLLVNEVATCNVLLQTRTSSAYPSVIFVTK